MEANVSRHGRTVSRLFSIKRAAEYWDVSPWTVRKWLQDGRVHSIKLGARRLIPEEEIERVSTKGLD
jgi:excisionase family DNA binding protein